MPEALEKILRHLCDIRDDFYALENHDPSPEIYGTVDSALHAAIFAVETAKEVAKLAELD